MSKKQVIVSTYIFEAVAHHRSLLVHRLQKVDRAWVGGLQVPRVMTARASCEQPLPEPWSCGILNFDDCMLQSEERRVNQFQDNHFHPFALGRSERTSGSSEFQKDVDINPKAEMMMMNKTRALATA